MDQLQTNVTEPAYQNIQKWLTEPKYAAYKDELVSLIESAEWEKLEDSFFKVVEFGTGGRRGTTGIGSNRINNVTIGESAQALCLYAQSFDAKAAEKGVVIACDTRLSSPQLSAFVAQVCAANGFKTYIFDSFRSTPELSFAVRELGCSIGIVISASHNPPLDNGFKAYWSDGGQLVAPHDKGVLTAADAITEVHTIDFEDGLADGRIIRVGEAIDAAYVAAAIKEAEGTERAVNIVYSPLHGAGQTNTLPILQAAGFASISTVTEQMVPDGNFPTVPGGKANPEEKAANDMAVAQLLKEEADIAITNDPDADRIGVIVRHNEDAFYLNGNQSAALATDYVLGKLRDKSTLTPKHYIAKTIVTTDLLDALAKHYDVQVYGNMLIGFKYIGELILAKENTDEIFVIGGEESYGLLKGTYTRDKDGAIGALPLAEYAAELKLQNKTLVDRLYELFAQHGVYAETLKTIYCLGASGFVQMQTAMEELRNNPPAEIDGHTITVVNDYKTLKSRSIATGELSDIDCVSGNVIVLEFGDRRRRVTVRPSGTEPKLKFYIQWYEDADGEVGAQYEAVQTRMDALGSALEAVVMNATS